MLNGGSTVLNFVGVGWYSEAGDHIASNKNYIAGLCGVAPDPCDNPRDLIYNDFFVFDLGNEPIVSSAVLRLWNPPTGYISTNPSELYKLYDVSTNVTDLMSSNTGEIGIFDDLGSGTQFGGRCVTAGDDGRLVKIPLDADAIDALDDSRGNSTIGGTLDLGPSFPSRPPCCCSAPACSSAAACAGVATGAPGR